MVADFELWLKTGEQAIYFFFLPLKLKKKNLNQGFFIVL
jgi:hypothetical protein